MGLRVNRWMNAYSADLSKGVPEAQTALISFIRQLGFNESPLIPAAQTMKMNNGNCIQKFGASVRVAGPALCTGSTDEYWVMDARNAIHSRSDLGLCLTDQGGNGSEVKLAACDAKNDAQSWTINSANRYSRGTRCIDLNSGYLVDNTNKLITYTCTNGGNQYWAGLVASNSLLLTMLSNDNIALLKPLKSHIRHQERDTQAPLTNHCEGEAKARRTDIRRAFSLHYCKLTAHPQRTHCALELRLPKRSRYVFGVMPNCLENRCRSACSDPSPERAAIVLSGRLVCSSSNCLARSSRADSNERSGRLRAFLHEQTAHVPLAHRRLFCQSRHGKQLFKMLKILLQTLHAAVLGRLTRQPHAELRLPARSLEVHDQIARHLQRQRVAEVFFHHSKRQIDSRGHACRRPERTIAHIDRIGIHIDARKLLLQRAATLQCVAAQRPSSSPPWPEKAARTQRNQTLHLGADPLQPLHQPARLTQHAFDVTRAHDDHRAAQPVALHIVKRMRSLQRHQRVGSHHAALGRNDAHVIPIGPAALAQMHVGIVEHRHGADGLQRLETGIDDQIDAMRACVTMLHEPADKSQKSKR